MSASSLKLIRMELTTRAYLNGREYEGSIYFGMEGILYAFCLGYTWGLDCGTCLAGLKDANGELITNQSYAEKGGTLHGQTITWD